MKKILLASVLSAAFVSPAVFAQAKNFEGFGIQLSTGYQNNEIKTTDLALEGLQLSNFGVSVPNSSKGEMPLNIGLGYTYALTERFTLGALVEYNPIAMNSGSGSLKFGGVTSQDPLDKFNSKLENQVSISLVPGYAFTDATMGYAKVGWINATAKFSPPDGTVSSNVNGLLLGLGAKHLFTKNIYGFAEATYATYGGSNSSYTSNANGAKISASLTPTSYSFLVGVGYKF
jgi:opacity protein-like surface antigen